MEIDKERKQEAVIRFRQRRKQELVYIMGGKCSLCGYDKCIAALDFHHTDPNNKKFQLSSGNCRSWEEDIDEIKKCALLCSNCHREVHFYSLEISPTFNEERFTELNDIKVYGKAKKYFCSECGSQITKNTNRCSSCYNLSRREIEWPTKEELKELIRTKPFTMIGELYGVRDNTIRKWCDYYKLPRRKEEINSFTDKEWENLEDYITDFSTKKKIINPEEIIETYAEIQTIVGTARKLNLDEGTVSKYLKQEGVEIIPSNLRKVVMIKNNNSIKEFNSIVEAADFLIKEGLTTSTRKIVAGSIGRVLRGARKTFLKYEWKYLN